MEELSIRLKFLDEASGILTSGGESPKLSSHLRYLHNQFLQHGEWKIPVGKDRLPSVCSQCFTEFRGKSFTITVKPSPKPSHNLMKILEKKARQQHLTGAQTVLLSNFEKAQGKKLVLKCGICKKETESTLKKQKGDYKSKTASTAQNFGANINHGTKKMSNITSTSKLSSHFTSHGKKKKKKDLYAGLKVAAVKSVKFKRKKK